MKILVACEESQIVTIAFRKLGHEAYSNDIIECSGGHPEWHLKMDVFEAIKNGCPGGGVWQLMIGHPPCDFITSSGVRWLKDQPPLKSGKLVGKERREAQLQSIEFFKKLYNCDIPLIALENPIGALSSQFRKPDQIIQPWMFGHGETKATCLWLKGLPKLIPTNIVEGREQLIHKMPPSSERSKLRSKTYQGIADALADQWTKLK